MQDRTGIGTMRDQLLAEFREPFIHRVDTTSTDARKRDVKIRKCDKRVKTLPDECIAELFFKNAIKMRALECGKKMEEVRNYILESLPAELLHGRMVCRPDGQAHVTSLLNNGTRKKSSWAIEGKPGEKKSAAMGI